MNLRCKFVLAYGNSLDIRERFKSLLKDEHITNPNEGVLDTIATYYSNQMLTATTPNVAETLYKMVKEMPGTETKMSVSLALGLASINGPVWSHRLNILSAVRNRGEQLMVKVLCVKDVDPKLSHLFTLEQIQEQRDFEGAVCSLLDLAHTTLPLVQSEVVDVVIPGTSVKEVGMAAGKYHAIVMPRFAITLAETAQLSVDCVLSGGVRMKEALDYIHSHNLVHMDVKPDNIFLTQSGTWYLGDFGSCRHIGDKILSYTDVFYPECLYGQPAKPAYDWYMLAVSLLIELLPDKRKWRSNLCRNKVVARDLVDASIHGLVNERARELLYHIMKRFSDNS